MKFENGQLYLYKHPDGLYLWKCVPEGMVLIASTGKANIGHLTPFSRMDDHTWNNPTKPTSEDLARLL
jgi:hypothetical protein